MISRPASVYTLEYGKKIFLALMFKGKSEANIETFTHYAWSQQQVLHLRTK